MVNINTQTRFTLPPDINGYEPKLNGDLLFNHEEIHAIPNAEFSFTIDAGTECHLFGAGTYCNDRPILRGMHSEYNGSRHGGICVIRLSDHEMGQPDLRTFKYAGEVGNITPILETNRRQVVRGDGKKVFGLLGVKNSALTENGFITDDCLQVTFVVIDDSGEFVAHTLAPGTYIYGANGIYSSPAARYRGLSVTGSRTTTPYEENATTVDIEDKIYESQGRGYTITTITGDHDLVYDESYIVTFSYEDEGGMNVEVDIKGNFTGNNNVPKSVNYFRPHIKAKAGVGIQSGITAYFNGTVVYPDLITVTEDAGITSVIIDNSSRRISDGPLVVGDTFHIEFRADPDEEY